MITEVKAGPYTVKGLSVGGVYTGLCIPELRIALDVGIALRCCVGVDRLFLSHGHADHVGALVAFLGSRALMNRRSKLRVYLPQEIEDHVHELLKVATAMQRYDLSVDTVPLRAGDEVPLHSNLVVQAFRTHHRVPSLGFQFVRRVDKLKPEFHGLPGPEIAERRRRGDDLFRTEHRLELAYATDTLARVLDTNPSMLRSQVLILECTFLDERKSLAHTHAGCHIHLDELIARAASFENEHLVLMHFSQIYHPHEIGKILRHRCPKRLLSRIVPFVSQQETPVSHPS